MSLLYLLDANITSHYLRRTSAWLEQRVSDGLLQQSLAISVLTRAELRFGQSGMAADDRRRSLIDQWLLLLPNLPWTHQAADHYGILKDAHRRGDTPIGEIDTQIAAHAQAEGLTLVTLTSATSTESLALYWKTGWPGRRPRPPRNASDREPQGPLGADGRLHRAQQYGHDPARRGFPRRFGARVVDDVERGLKRERLTPGFMQRRCITMGSTCIRSRLPPAQLR